MNICCIEDFYDCSQEAGVDLWGVLWFHQGVEVQLEVTKGGSQSFWMRRQQGGLKEVDGDRKWQFSTGAKRGWVSEQNMMSDIMATIMALIGCFEIKVR